MPIKDKTDLIKDKTDLIKEKIKYNFSFEYNYTNVVKYRVLLTLFFVCILIVGIFLYIEGRQMFKHLSGIIMFFIVPVLSLLMTIIIRLDKFVSVVSRLTRRSVLYDLKTNVKTALLDLNYNPSEPDKIELEKKLQFQQYGPDDLDTVINAYLGFEKEEYNEYMRALCYIQLYKNGEIEYKTKHKRFNESYTSHVIDEEGNPSSHFLSGYHNTILRDTEFSNPSLIFEANLPEGVTQDQIINNHLSKHIKSTVSNRNLKREKETLSKLINSGEISKGSIFKRITGESYEDIQIDYNKSNLFIIFSNKVFYNSGGAREYLEDIDAVQRLVFSDWQPQSKEKEENFGHKQIVGIVLTKDVMGLDEFRTEILLDAIDEDEKKKENYQATVFNLDTIERSSVAQNYDFPDYLDNFFNQIENNRTGLSEYQLQPTDIISNISIRSLISLMPPTYFTTTKNSKLDKYFVENYSEVYEIDGYEINDYTDWIDIPQDVLLEHINYKNLGYSEKEFRDEISKFKSAIESFSVSLKK